MNMHPVSSSNIAEIGHDPARNALRVRFKTGETYEYPEVDAAGFEAMKSAKSVGSHFHAHVRHKAGKMIE